MAFSYNNFMHWAGKECFVKVMQTTKASNFNQKCIRIDERNCEKPESYLAKQHKETWNRVLSNRRYIKEVRGKFIQFEVLQSITTHKFGFIR